MKSTAKGLAHGAMGAAATVLLLWGASVLPSARLALLCAASLGVVLTEICDGPRSAWTCYGAATLLALLLLPRKGPAAVYGLFAGYYPIVKLRLEQLKSPWLRWGGKLLLFNGALGALCWIFRGRWEVKLPLWALFSAGNGLFVLYDFALKQVILICLRKIVGRMR